MSGDGDLELDDLAARALASILLERTADTIKDQGAQAALGLVQLADDTGLSLDVCAAVLMATSWLAGAGGLTADEVFAASLAMEPELDEMVEAVADEVDTIIDRLTDDVEGVAVPDDPDWQSMIPDAIRNPVGDGEAVPDGT